ncbi:DUF2914 domain-containing protein [Geobacter argillaceus]|uniref:DUF2914 domain-containing protein n=1 Tax=Geobacter argillaceus TaxID=345631 RepID=A0A562WTC6_9BACT|nr:DUF2914 domain-containing protein [Geobacter argillaceus]TWJ32694.1 Protein of unknown function (DUF2914) [Geobacter argillaceus]
MKHLLVLASALFMLLAQMSHPVQAAESDLKITELAVTTKIVRNKPIDSVHRISSASVKALYCFTRITAPEDTDTTIKHVWYRGDEKAGEYELPVKGERWRTFSKKEIQRGWAGDWRVEILDSDGNLLQTVKFRIN